MCGIVGYVGPQNALNFLIEGLKRVEYRGYDSAGVAVFPQNGGRYESYKCKGTIAALEREVSPLQQLYISGIGHTRWATHGEPTERNAHPHFSADRSICVVHNGIIENYDQLRQLLQEDGVIFSSETDTEVLAHLIAGYYRPGEDLLKAVSRALQTVEGTYALAVQASDQPELIVGARNGSPLIVGVGDGEMFLASDISAVVSHTEKVIYLEDGELVSLTRNGFHTFNLQNMEIDKKVEDIQFQISKIDKDGFDHFMLKEIYEQPYTVADCFRGRLLPEQGNVKLGGLELLEGTLHKINRITITACGTSWHAALVGEYLIEELAGIPVEVEYASEYRYRNPATGPDTLVVVISQSGETADTLAALREAKMRGNTLVGICNGIGSTIARETDCGIYVHAGLEIGVASTKAFTSQVTALFLLAIKLGRSRGLSGSRGVELVGELMAIPEKISSILEDAESIKKIASIFLDCHNCLYLGRGYHFPIALEGALKLKEISYIHAEGYPAAEMKHGPIALIDEGMPVVVIALHYGVYDKVLSNIHEIIARKGRVIAIAHKGDEHIGRLVDQVIYIPGCTEALSPILSAVPLQLLAYYIAIARGCNVDQPRNLAKSVTVE